MNHFLFLWVVVSEEKGVNPCPKPYILLNITIHLLSNAIPFPITTLHPSILAHNPPYLLTC